MSLLHAGYARLATRRFAVSAIALVLPLSFIGNDAAFAKAPVQQPVLTAAAAAVADKYAAVAAGQIFKEGGNAVDAAVAIAFSLAVTYPEAGNLGGGGFMTLYVADKPYFLDYRERAPAAASRNMYLDDKGDVVKGMSLIGDKAAGVPGTVDGMWQVQRRFGKLTWKQVLAPALHYARDGFEVEQQLQDVRESEEKNYEGKTNFNQYFGGLKAGVTFKQPELARTLQRIADHGGREFYTGKTAELIVAHMRESKWMSRQDLVQYRAVWRQPIVAKWNGYDVITAPPPSSGGVGLIQLLKMKEDRRADFDNVPLNSAQYIHLIAEIEKRVFADRAQYLGDPDYYKVPVAQLTDNAYIAKRAAEVNPKEPSDTKSVQPGLGMITPPRVSRVAAANERAETTHFSVVDKWGNAVSNTYTLNGYFGSGVVVEGAGFLLNNEMDDFSSKPGVPNLYGVVGSDANAIEPGKRPLSSMTPTILTKDRKLALVIGTPGGSRIFTSVFQVITDLYDFKMPAKEAIAAMRFHHQLLPPNTIFWEPYRPIEGALAEQLQKMGYTLKGQDFNGDIQLVKINGDSPEPVADPRKRGVARVFP
jgi:gamma-glutamyltranspeptidase / glutathione hydrolase